MVVFLENDDSFSWNVVATLPVPRARVRVVSARERADVDGALAGARALVVGPGPLDPQRAGLVAITKRAVERGLPTLGVCLGHQAIGVAFGARLVRVEPAHGVTASVDFAPSRLLPGIVGRRRVMRYHSLALADVPAPLAVIAATDDGIPMAMEHAFAPVLGLQFHPDSFATEDGPEMVHAFFRAAGIA